MITVFSQLLALFVSLQSAPAPEPAAPAPAPADSLRVVELFTSQGCPMCPGANEVLAQLGESEADLLAIAYGVDYWDVYGWEDTFAMAEFTARQHAYVAAGDAHRVYTPHFIVNGAPEKLRYSEDRVRAAVDGASPLPALARVETGLNAVTISLDGPARETPALVWLVTYHPGVETRLIEDGPNAGREMVHYNMARDIQRLSDWTGGPLSLDAPAPAEGLASAVLVQAGPGGPILSAARVAPR